MSNAIDQLYRFACMQIESRSFRDEILFHRNHGISKTTLLSYVSKQYHTSKQKSLQQNTEKYDLQI